MEERPWTLDIILKKSCLLGRMAAQARNGPPRRYVAIGIIWLFLGRPAWREGIEVYKELCPRCTM
jgi:hypothetical protein